jgi:hypothetical protein
MKLNDTHGETRTHNLQIRSLTRYPLRHAGLMVPLTYYKCKISLNSFKYLLNIY